MYLQNDKQIDISAFKIHRVINLFCFDWLYPCIITFIKNEMIVN